MYTFQCQCVVALLGMETLAFFLLVGLKSHLGVMSTLPLFILSLDAFSPFRLMLIPFMFSGKSKHISGPLSWAINRAFWLQLTKAQLHLLLIRGAISWVRSRDFNGPKLLGYLKDRT